MMEAGVLIGHDGGGVVVLHWHVPKDRNGGSLPDSTELWQKIWTHRNEVVGFAHSHPGSGPPMPSHTDITTFAAIEAALGKSLIWWITTADQTAAFYALSAPGATPLPMFDCIARYTHARVEPGWVNALRKYSGY